MLINQIPHPRPLYEIASALILLIVKIYNHGINLRNQCRPCSLTYFGTVFRHAFRNALSEGDGRQSGQFIANNVRALLLVYFYISINSPLHLQTCTCKIVGATERCSVFILLLLHVQRRSR